jgi:hypothetical protein
MNFDSELLMASENKEPLEELPSNVIERMKIVFRSTHGAEMDDEDRNLLGIPQCEAASETLQPPSILVLLQLKAVKNRSAEGHGSSAST